MNPIFQWIVAHTALRARSRVCGRCGNTQIVPASKSRETVACRSCDNPLPPRSE